MKVSLSVLNNKQRRRKPPMAFRTSIKVCFSDIDNAGIVYYPRFMHYFHLAMEEFFSLGLGIAYSDVLHTQKVTFPTVHVEAKFLQKLKYGDRIEMEVRVIKIGRTSIHWGYRGYRTENTQKLVVEGSNVTVCVSSDKFKKIEVPSWLRKGLQPHTEVSN
jgi:4-hydroxybenzoyl-CoA thioesterase